MKAALISRPGGPEVLEVREVPTPHPQADQVLVRVMAAGLNHADLLQRQGRYPAPPGAPPEIPGIEFAGEVVEVGSQARLWRPGQRVFGIAGGGAHAEYLVAHERMLAEIPVNLDWTEAGGIPEVFITAHDALWRQAGLRPAERVLIHAVGSGVGLAALQLARAMGAIPYGTTRTAEKLERARALGLEDGVVLQESFEPLVEKTKTWTGGHGFDVVLDLVGGPYVAPSIAVLGMKGRLMLVATAGGRRAELDLSAVMVKRLTIRGTVLRPRPLEEKIAATQAFIAEVVPLLARGTLRANIDSRFPLVEVRDAHQRLESGRAFGKVVLQMTD